LNVALRSILFDFDGTLVQTREASWQLFAETNREFDLKIDSREQFYALFERNLFQSLKAHCADAQRFERVKAHFLDLLRRQYCPDLIPGVVDVIRPLAARYSLAILSTNTMQAIRRVLEKAGVAHCFAHVFSGEVEPDKAACIRRFVADASYGFGRRCSPAYHEDGGLESIEGDEVVLVTDTVGDVKEAVACNVRAIGVAWGMHSQQQLLQAGAEFVAIWPQELLTHLLTDAKEGSLSCACGNTTAAACAPLPQSKPAVGSGPNLNALALLRRSRRVAATDDLRSRLDRVPAARPGSSEERLAATLIPAVQRILEDRRNPRDRVATS
jgi:phosphoglycolate phosphatase